MALSRRVACATLIIITACILGCNGSTGPSPIIPGGGGGGPSIPQKDVVGSVELPAGTPIDYEDLTIITASGTDAVGADGSFSTRVPRGCYSFVYVVNQEEDIIAAAFDTLVDGGAIDAEATARAIVMMFPVEWGQARITPDELITAIEESPYFDTLLGYVENVMVNDPENLINYQAHPAILEAAADIIWDVLSSRGWPPAERENSAYVMDVGGSPDVEIHNPKATPYGISGCDQGGDPSQASSYFLLGRKYPMWADGTSLINMIAGWLGFGTGEDVRAYALGDGSFILVLSKIDPAEFSRSLSLFGVPGTFQDLADHFFGLYSGDRIEIMRTDARLKGTMGGIGYFATRAIGLVPGGGDIASIVIDLVLEAANNGSLASTLNWNQTIIDHATSADGMLEGLGIVVQLVEHNADHIATELFENAAMASSIRVGSRALGEILQVPGIVDLILFMWDLYTADQEVTYTIQQSDGWAVILSSLPPSIPDIDLDPLGYEGEPVQIAVSSVDPEGDAIRYLIYYGDGGYDTSPSLPSGAVHYFTHSWLSGEYGVTVYATDANGATSAAAEEAIHIVPFGGFYEDFDAYSVGGIPSATVWNTEYVEPSRVMITDQVHAGPSGRSCKFIDFDPDIGDVQGYYAVIWTEVFGDPVTAEFYVRVSDYDDAFGVRTWGFYGDWGTMAYYILTLDSHLCWVRYGADPDDPNDFVRFLSITPGTWYRVVLDVDWSGQTYDIYVDGSLEVAGATFVGYAYTAPTWQAVAFADETCGAAYLDNIYMQGATIGRPTAGLVTGSAASMTAR
jgi:hypothetical protein